MEVGLHLRMQTEMQYAPIYCAFAVSAGLALGLLPSMLLGRWEKGFRIAGLFLVWLVFAAESIAYLILQSYYPISALGTAAENRLYDYIDIIKITVLQEKWYLLIMLVPCILGCLIPPRRMDWDNRKKSMGRKSSDVKSDRRRRTAGVAAVVILAVLFHFAGIAIMNMDWGEGEMIPSKLYEKDENLDIQVERLGLVTMLRLDVIHQLFPSTVAMPDMSVIPDAELEPEPEPVPVEDPVDRSPNVMDIDLTPLMESSNSKVKWLASYMNSVTPTNKNEYTGMFEGYNVVFLSIEAFSGAGIDPELTPTLYKLSNECFVFENFYTPLYYGSTNAGECQNLLGLYPKQGSPMSLQETGRLGTNCYFALGPQLGRLGYRNIGYHNGWDMYGRASTMKNLGYAEWKYLGHGMKAEKWGSGGYKWPQRDTFMIENTVSEYATGDTPFNVYYMTISGHTPYSWGWIANQYRDELNTRDWSTSTKQYMATVMEVDRALEALLNELEAADQLDRTLIVAVADHIPYTAVEAVGELRGTNYGTSDAARNCNERYLDTEVYRNTLIMWTGSMSEKVVVDKVCTQVDILPTVSNLLGLEYDSRLLPGTDMLSDSQGLVIFYSKSWRSDYGLYNAYTGEFTLNEGYSFSEAGISAYVENMNKTVECKRDMTQMILQTDFYDLLFPE